MEKFSMRKTNELTVEKMNELLDWTYEKTLNGIPTMDTAYDLADEYTKKYGVEKGIDRLITTQLAACGTSGFLAGVSGLILLPIAVPANVSSVLFIQMRMIAAIAVMRGYDLKDDQIRTFVYIALTGKAAGEMVRQTGIQVGQKLTVTMIKKIPAVTVQKINKKVGFRLLTKFGKTGVINLGKMVPLVGGVVGGAYDATTTKVIASAAKELFEELPRENRQILEQS